MTKCLIWLLCCFVRGSYMYAQLSSVVTTLSNHVRPFLSYSRQISKRCFFISGVSSFGPHFAQTRETFKWVCKMVCTDPCAICRARANSRMVIVGLSVRKVAQVLMLTSLTTREGAPGPPGSRALSHPLSKCSYQR